MPNINLESLTEEIHQAMVANNDKDIKLLNVCHKDKEHNYWRFRTPDGQIFQISIWREDPPGEMWMPVRISETFITHD